MTQHLDLDALQADLYATLNCCSSTLEVDCDVLSALIDRLRKAEAARDIPEGMLARVQAAQERIQNNHAPRRIPADPTDVDLVLAEVFAFLTGKPQPFWVAAPDSTSTDSNSVQPETQAEFALRALVAAGHITQEKVDRALEIAGKFTAHTRTPTDSADSEGAK